MLKILGLSQNPQIENDYFRKLTSTRNKNSSSKFLKPNANTNIIPTSSSKKISKNLSKACNDNTAKKKNRRKSSLKNSKEKKNIKGYKYIQQKAFNYINACNKINNDKINNINNIVNMNNNSSKKNKNRNKKNSKARQSIEEPNDKIKNLTCDKKIKEIKIKAKFNMSYINLFVNKSTNNQNQMTCTNKERMSTVSNIYKSAEKNNNLLDSVNNGVYRKKLKIFNSLSMEKMPRVRNKIQSIDISFSPKLHINKFQANNNYEYDKEKIIFIQKKFRKFLVRKYRRIFNEKITVGILCLNRLMKNKIFFCYKNILLYGNSNNNKDVYYVEESQMELLNILKEKNIYSMTDLKKYIVCLIKKNKFEMF